MGEKILSHRDLQAYQKAFRLATEVFDLSKSFPKEETYSLTDQVRRSSRSVCANLAEAWRKRRYRGAFISKLSDAETEAAETQVWLEFALQCGYLESVVGDCLGKGYDEILALIVSMIRNANHWTFRSKKARPDLLFS